MVIFLYVIFLCVHYIVNFLYGKNTNIFFVCDFFVCALHSNFLYGKNTNIFFVCDFFCV